MLRFLVLLIFTSSTALGFEPPSFTPNVVDSTGTLSREDIDELNHAISQLRSERQILAAVLVVATTGSEPIETAAERTFQAWRLGEDSSDNGLLVMAALNDRRVRIEVGYGLEGSIPDLVAKQVIDATLAPNFRRGDYAGGLLAALAMLHTVSGGVEAEQGRAPHPSALNHASDDGIERGYIIAGIVWFCLIVVAPILLRITAVRRARRFPPHLQPTPEEQAWWRLASPSAMSVFLTAFLLVNPGIFFVMFTQSWQIVFAPLFLGFAYIFLGVTNSGYIAMLRERSREKFKAAPQLRRGASGSQPRQAFHGSWNSGSATSSSRSSGSSWSSSSRGGSSGGGGASGSW